MAYCTQSDVEMAAGGAERLLALSDWENLGAIGAANVTSAIAKADAWINTFVHKRYAVDIPAPVPPAIVDLSASEAVFRLKRMRGMVDEDDLAERDERRKLLDDFATGRNTLGVSPMPLKSELVVDNQSARPTDKQVSRLNTKGFW